MRTLRWIGLVGVLVVVLAAATGTATGKQAGSTGPQASARASLPPYVVLAKKKVAEYSALDKMKFSFPTDSYDPGSKNVAIITGGNGVPVLVENAKYVQDAFNAMGWKAPTIYDGKFAPIEPEVLHHYEADATGFRYPAKELLERFEPARRGAQTNDRKPEARPGRARYWRG